jgi:alpha-beta hydrolase superfamily lysophospholipase
MSSGWFVLVALAGAMRANTQHVAVTPRAPYENVNWVDGAFAQPGRPTLRYHHWTSDAAEWDRTAVLVIMHGYGEHSGSYSALASFLVGRRHPVCGLDARGHGESPGQRGHIPDYQQYVEDLCAFLARVRERYLGRPLLLLGHSAGGLIATRALQHAPELADALILSSPLFALQARHRPLGGFFARLAGTLVPRLPLGHGIDDSELTHDLALLTEFAQDIARHRRTTPAWYWATLRAMRQVEAHAASIALPALVFAAGEDSVADPRAVVRVTQLFASRDKQLVIRDRAYHEVLHEVDRDDVYALIAGWIRMRFS